LSIRGGVLEEKAIRGVPWTFLQYGGSKVITVATTLVLARLLTPADFGVVALAQLTAALFAMLGDVGLTRTLIVRQDFDARAKGTVLTGVFALGALVAVTMAATAPLVAALFDEPRLTEVLYAFAPMALLTMVSWFYDALLVRELEFPRRSAAQITQWLAYAVVAISLAALGAGVWSMVIGLLVGIVTQTVVLIVLAPYHVWPAFEPSIAKDVYRTSRAFLVQATSEFIRQNAGYMIVGRVLGTAQLGYYSLALRWSDMPHLAVADPMSQITFPSYARLQHRREDYVACPLGLMLSAAADPLVRTLLGERWLPMIGPLAVLGVWGAVRAPQFTVIWYLNAIGRAGLTAFTEAALLAALIPGVVFAAHEWGLTGVAWVMLATMSASLVLLSVVAVRVTPATAGGLWASLRPIVVGGVMAWVAARLVANSFDPATPALALCLALAAGLATYATSVSLLEPGLISTTLQQLRRTFRRKQTASNSP
jgi:lipopolysaccharide exporter